MSVTANKETSVDILKTFKQIIVRDIRSESVLQNIGVNATLMPDAAFLLQGNAALGYELIKKLFKTEHHDLYSKIVVCVFNAHLGVVDDDRYLARDQMTFLKNANDLASIIDNTSASFIFIPFGQYQPWDDRITNAWLASKCKFYKKNLVIYDRISFQQVLDIVACADTVISSRLHASIFSCVTNVPFIDITHHDKNLGFLQTVGLEDWSVPYWRFDYTKCNTLLKEFLTNAMPHKDRLQKITEQQRHQIKEVIKNVHILPY